MLNSMVHWNGDQLCVIDTETTGLDPCWHEIIQICILPLDSDIKPRHDILPFNIYLKPEHPERAERKAMKTNKIKLAHIANHGIDREMAKDLLEDWIKRLKLPYTKYGTQKHIRPLGHNYSFDKHFILNWMGVNLMNSFFDYHYSDTMIAALYINDRLAMHGQEVMFPKVNLAYVANILQVEHTHLHDALVDCRVTAECYRKMLMQGLLG